jgi:hypothetical protein
MASLSNQAWCVLWVALVSFAVAIQALPRVPLLEDGLGEHIDFQVRESTKDKPEIRNNGKTSGIILFYA